MKLTTEYHGRIYNDETGDYLAIEPNVDGLDGLLEIKSVVVGTQGDSVEGRLVLDYTQVRALMAALAEVLRLNPEPKPDINQLIRDIQPTPAPGFVHTPFFVGQNDVQHR